MVRYIFLAFIFVFSIASANEVTYVEWDSGTGGRI